MTKKRVVANAEKNSTDQDATGIFNDEDEDEDEDEEIASSE